MKLLLSELFFSRRPARSWAELEAAERGEPFHLGEARRTRFERAKEAVFSEHHFLLRALVDEHSPRKTLVGIPVPAILSGKPPFSEAKS